MKLPIAVELVDRTMIALGREITNVPADYQRCSAAAIPTVLIDKFARKIRPESATPEEAARRTDGRSRFGWDKPQQMRWRGQIVEPALQVRSPTAPPASAS